MTTHETPYQALITRMPYSLNYDPAPLFEFSRMVDERGLICISMPMHVESPNNGGRLIHSLEMSGLTLVAVVSWHRDRHIVCSKSKRLTNCWEPIAIFSRSKNYVLNREAASKIKRGFESRETAFDEDEYLTCQGDHWAVRNDRRDRRFLPETVVLNCGQLADLQTGHRVLDPFGNPGVRDACTHLGWEYFDGGLPSDARAKAKISYMNEEPFVPIESEKEEQAHA